MGLGRCVRAENEAGPAASYRGGCHQLRSRDQARIWKGGISVLHGDCQAADIAHKELLETKELPWCSQALQELQLGTETPQSARS